MVKREERAKILISFFVLILITVGIFFLANNTLTGNVISLDKNSFLSNENLQGKYALSLKEGELIPDGSKFILEYGDEKKEYSIQEFIELTNSDITGEYGDYYVENSKIEGNGFGYGKAGKITTNPEIFFKLKIIKETNETLNETNITSNETIINETAVTSNETEINISEELNQTFEINQTSETNETIEIPEENQTEESEENLTEEPEQPTAEENNTEEPIEQPIEEPIIPPEEPIEEPIVPEEPVIPETPEENPVEPPVEEPTEPITETAETTETTEIGETETETTPETSEEPTSESTEPAESTSEESTETEAPQQAQITGNFLTFFAIANKFVGIWNGFIISEIKDGEISASVSRDSPFYYTLELNERAELIEDSINDGNETLSKSILNLDKEEDKLKITTDYSKNDYGFGENYLGNVEKYQFNLDNLNISFNQTGNYSLKISLIYDEEVIDKQEVDMKIVGTPKITVINRAGKTVDELELNNTEASIKLEKIKINGKENYGIVEEETTEGTNTNSMLTGSAITEIEMPLPSTELNFNEIPEDLVIQIDKPTSELQAQGASTEIIAVQSESNQTFSITESQIVLEKTTDNQINNIIYCDDWNLGDFKCNNEWQDAELDFIDNGTFISFNVTHFTAYAGNYTGESNTTNLEIWDLTDDEEGNQIIHVGKNNTFYARYTNNTDNVSISGQVYCNFSENSSGSWSEPEMMSQLESLDHAYVENFNHSGNFSFNISCFAYGTNSGYDNLSAIDSFEIRDGECVGEDYNFTCGDIVNESCTMASGFDCDPLGAHALAIFGDNILLDCNNFNINYNGSSWTSTKGVYAYNSSNITVKNCFIQFFDTGIYYENMLDGYIINNTPYHNGGSGGMTGINLYGTNNTLIENNTVLDDQGVGIYLEESNENNLTNNILFNNTEEGILLLTSSGNILTNNNATLNGREGISLNTDANYNILMENIANENGWGGIFIRESEYNLAINNTVELNLDSGLIIGDSNNNNVSQLISNNNSIHGIQIYGNWENATANNSINDSVITYNQQYGIYIDPANGTLNTSFINTYFCFNNQSLGAYEDYYDGDSNIETNTTCDTSYPGGICDNSCTLSGPITEGCIGATYNFTCGDVVNESCTMNGNLTSSGSCFNISTNDVTLDCNGHTLLGIENNSIGITIGTAGNILIKNCIFKNNLTTGNSTTFVYSGIEALGTAGNLTLYNNIFLNNTRGINVQNFITGANISKNTFTDGDVALIIWTALSITENITVADNYGTGLGVPTYYNGIVNFRFIYNNLYVYNNYFEQSMLKTRNLIELRYVNNSEIYNNTFVGLSTNVNMWLVLSDNNHIYNNTFNRGTDGINVDRGANNLIENNLINNSYHHGIILYISGSPALNVTNTTIKSNTIVNSAYYGVTTGDADDNDATMVVNTSIENNYFENCDNGIYLGFVGLDRETIIKNNTFYNNSRNYYFRGYGLRISGSSTNNLIQDNNFTSNRLGIYFSSTNNTFENNLLNDNYLGMYTPCEEDSCFEQTIDTTNLIDGKSIYYIKNGEDTIYSGENMSTFYCINCSNISLFNLSSLSAGTGIFLWRTQDSSVYNSTSHSNFRGIHLLYSSNNTFENISTYNATSLDYLSGVPESYHCGAFLDSSFNNSFKNLTTNSSATGIVLYNATSNLFKEAIITDAYGLWVDEKLGDDYNYYGSNYNLFQDSIISGLYWGIMYAGGEGMILDPTTCRNNSLLNSSYGTISMQMSEASDCHSLYVQWYLDVYANYTNGTAVEGANVVGYRSNGQGIEFNVTTNSSGYIERQNATEYIVSAGDAFEQITTYYTDYSINASKESFFSETELVNLTTNAIIGLNGPINLTLRECGCDTGDFNYTCGETIMESCTMNCNLDSEGTCFTIGANNSILDGAGYSITGDNVSGRGVYCNGPDNITIKNLTINNFGEQGIYLRGSTNSVVSNNHINECFGNGGILFASVVNATIENNVINNSSPGILENFLVYNSTIRSNHVSNVPNDAFFIDEAESNNVYSDNRVENCQNGFLLGGYTANNYSFINNSVYNCTNTGFWLINTENSRISNNLIYNSSTGINLQGSSNNVLENNTIYLNRIAVWAKDGAFNNTLIDSVISDSESYDIISNLSSSNNNTFLNVSFNKSKVNITTGTIYVNWYLDNYVIYTIGGTAVSGATVLGYDNQSALIFNSTTNSSGYTERQNVTEYHQNSTGIYYHTNCSVTASKAGMTPATRALNLTTNYLGTTFTLTLGVPSGGGGEQEPSCGDESCNGDETCSTCEKDCGACKYTCGDKICESSLGENCTLCSADCGTCVPVCGNNLCELGEDYTTCQEDCCTPEGEISSIGNCCSPLKALYIYSDIVNCKGASKSFICGNCGNGICGTGEDNCNCPSDCNVTMNLTWADKDFAVNCAEFTQNAGLNLNILYNPDTSRIGLHLQLPDRSAYGFDECNYNGRLGFCHTTDSATIVKADNYENVRSILTQMGFVNGTINASTIIRYGLGGATTIINTTGIEVTNATATRIYLSSNAEYQNSNEQTLSFAAGGGTGIIRPIIDWTDDNSSGRLKFYRILSYRTYTTYNIENISDKPYCDSGAWFTPSGDLLDSSVSCSSVSDVRCSTTYEQEGWYAVLNDGTASLLKSGTCAQAVTFYCPIPTNPVVKFNQTVMDHGPNALLNTSINWIVAPENVQTAADLLIYTGADYVAEWNPEMQVSGGAAQGKLIFTQNGTTSPIRPVIYPIGKYPIESTPALITRAISQWPIKIPITPVIPTIEYDYITGDFNVTPGKPYFISYNKENNNNAESLDLVYTGTVPAPVTFELKAAPNSFNENYIVLPLNTTIKKASQLCNSAISGIPINTENQLIWWSPELQDYLRSSRTCAQIIQRPAMFDFDLVPGMVYLITVLGDATWTQR